MHVPPRTLDDLLLYRTSRLLSVAGSLAEQAQLDRARTSRAVTSLVRKGLVSREQPAGDQRHVLLRLTAPGKKLHANLYPLVSAINTELLGALKDDEVALLDDMLQRLHARSEAMVAAAADLPRADRRRREPSAAR